jgi:hypothetical protein
MAHSRAKVFGWQTKRQNSDPGKEPTERDPGKEPTERARRTTVVFVFNSKDNLNTKEDSETENVKTFLHNNHNMRYFMHYVTLVVNHSSYPHSWGSNKT